MIALAAWPALVRSVSSTFVDCETRSDSVRATCVTLRFTATPDENSTTPKNITSMTGTIMANSIAAMPRQSFTKPRARSEILFIGDIFIASRFHMKGSCCGEQPLAAVEIRNVEAEPGHVERPFIEYADDHGVRAARRRNLICEGAGEAAADDRIGEIDRGAGGIVLYVHGQAREITGAVKQHCNATAEIGFERGFIHAGVVGLMRIHQPCAVLRSRLQNLTCEKQQPRLDNREQQCKEHRRDQSEFDGGRTATVVSKSTYRVSDRDCCNGRRRHRKGASSPIWLPRRRCLRPDR